MDGPSVTMEAWGVLERGVDVAVAAYTRSLAALERCMPLVVSVWFVNGVEIFETTA
jgi:hypothetical protein